MLVWTIYHSDLGRIYPLIEVDSYEGETYLIDILPNYLKTEILDLKKSCPVSGLVPRRLKINFVASEQTQIVYPLPFSQTLNDFLTARSDILSFEFIPENIARFRVEKIIDLLN